MVKFSNRKDLERWLKGKPRSWSVVLAVRSALRVAPLLATALGPRGGGGSKVAREIILPVFRGIAAPWVAGAWPTHGPVVRDAPAAAARAAAYATAYATDAAAAATTAAAHAAYANAAYAAYADASYSDASYAAAAAAAAADASYAAAAAAAAAAHAADAWAAVSADVTALEEGREEPVSLALKALWPNDVPSWADNNWSRLKEALTKLKEDWDVWTHWYETRLYGAAVAGLPIEALELARVMIDEEIWQQGPKVVNAHIKELIAQFAPPAPPLPPAEGPGPHLRPTPSGFEIVPTLPTTGERDDPTQISLHAQLNRRVERLKEAMPRVQNTHKPLFDEFNDYANFAGSDLATLDVPSLWSAGAALNDMVEALARVDKASRSMVERLEPDILSQLRSLLRDHTTFIMGFAQGQELAARAAALRLLDIKPTELGRRAKGVLSPMLDTSSLLAKHARSLIQAIDRALDTSDETTLALMTAAVATATRSIVAFGRAVAPIVASAAVASSITGINVSTLIGDPNAETLRAALNYLIQNANALSAFASHDAQLKVWLDWLISEMRRNAHPAPD